MDVHHLPTDVRGYLDRWLGRVLEGVGESMIIGSTAMKHWFPNERDPVDLDTFCPAPNAPMMDRSQDNFWDDRLLEYQGVNQWYANRFATVDELYTVKVSHSYWEIGNTWAKHTRDIQFLKANGAKLIPELHDILYPIWEDKHGVKKMHFMQKDNFFKDAVTRVYDHDSLHDSVAYGPEAMYIRTLKQEGHTAVDMDYIKGMLFEDQVKLYREEVCATALERIMVPSNYMGSAGAAYLWALRRTITSLTKGWSARFIVDNYSYFAEPCNYLERHLANRHKLIKLET